MPCPALPPLGLICPALHGNKITGKKRNPSSTQTRPGEVQGSCADRRSPCLDEFAVPSADPQGKKVPEDANRLYMFPEELVGNALAIFYGLQYQTDPKQKHLTLHEVRICHPTRITPKSTEKSAIHRLFIYLFWRGFLNCISCALAATAPSGAKELAKMTCRVAVCTTREGTSLWQSSLHQFSVLFILGRELPRYMNVLLLLLIAGSRHNIWAVRF